MLCCSPRCANALHRVPRPMMRDPDSPKHPADKRFGRFFALPRLASSVAGRICQFSAALQCSGCRRQHSLSAARSTNYTQLRVFNGERSCLHAQAVFRIFSPPCPVLLCARKQRPVPERERARRRSELSESVGQAARSSAAPGERRGRPGAHNIRAVHAGGRAAGKDETAPALETFARPARRISESLVGWLRSGRTPIFDEQSL